MANPMRLAESGSEFRLELRGIRKAYSSVVANNGIDLGVAPGEIHAVLGENGAGKSTLMKIIYGVVRPDAGQILWDGQQVTLAGPADARRIGIGMVFQHFALFETLTAVENIALGMTGKPDLGDLSHQISAVSERYGLPVDPHRLVHSMSVGERQRVEIVRALLQNPRLLIMDEPTSVLTPQAVQRLFETLRRLAEEGVSILYISHKLDEIRKLCRKATVLRAGKVTGVCDPRAESASNLARMMIGRDLPAVEHPEPVISDQARLVVENLTVRASDPFGTDLDGINVTVNGGEIVGIAGISGNGQRELLAALSGEEPLVRADALRLCGQPAGTLDPLARRRRGFGFIPEERLGRGAIQSFSLIDNALLTAHDQGMVRHGMILPRQVRSFSDRCVKEFDVRCAGSNAQIGSLSGGNVQKFIVGREILQRPKVLVVAQPTWGVDVGAAVFIRQSLVDLRNAGTAVLVISEEIDELFDICDRIAVIAKGRLSPCKRVQETNVREIGLLMTSLWEEPTGAEGREGHRAAVQA